MADDTGPSRHSAQDLWEDYQRDQKELARLNGWQAGDNFLTVALRSYGGFLFTFLNPNTYSYQQFRVAWDYISNNEYYFIMTVTSAAFVAFWPAAMYFSRRKIDRKMFLMNRFDKRRFFEQKFKLEMKKIDKVDLIGSPNYGKLAKNYGKYAKRISSK